MDQPIEPIKLTAFSHGSGCGCKIAPAVLSRILGENASTQLFPNLLIGNSTRDDAAVMAIDDELVIISTTDFFMPIVDDPFDFGGIASVNAISDIYAMGGKPLMAIAILGWPIDKLSPEIAAQVMDGARAACDRAGIPLAGGHSIDSPEPIFGLAVTGIANKVFVKANSTATLGCELYLTKPLGIGILATAEKRGKLREQDLGKGAKLMLQLNNIGEQLGKLESVKAMTDVTGFGFLGHLIEMCEGANLSAEVDYSKVPLIDGIKFYLDQFIYPDMTMRNFQSYSSKVSTLTGEQLFTLCDPQTSGGLLIAVEPTGKNQFIQLCAQFGLECTALGSMVEKGEKSVRMV